MPALIAPLAGLLIGVAFHFASSRQLVRAAPGTAIETRAMLLVLAYTLLLYGPFNAYFLVFATDWAFVYLLDTSRHEALLVSVSLFADVCSVFFGFFFGRRFMKDQTASRLASLLIPTGALFVLFLVGAARRLGALASYAQYHGDFGVKSLGDSSLGYALVWLGSVLVGGTLWTARTLRHLGE